VILLCAAAFAGPVELGLGGGWIPNRNLATPGQVGGSVTVFPVDQLGLGLDLAKGLRPHWRGEGVNYLVRHTGLVTAQLLPLRGRVRPDLTLGAGLADTTSWDRTWLYAMKRSAGPVAAWTAAVGVRVAVTPVFGLRLSAEHLRFGHLLVGPHREMVAMAITLRP
jgi:hypothetical protein